MSGAAQRSDPVGFWAQKGYAGRVAQATHCFATLHAAGVLPVAGALPVGSLLLQRSGNENVQEQDEEWLGFGASPDGPLLFMQAGDSTPGVPSDNRVSFDDTRGASLVNMALNSSKSITPSPLRSAPAMMLFSSAPSTCKRLLRSSELMLPVSSTSMVRKAACITASEISVLDLSAAACH